MASIMIGSFACPLMASAKVATGIACEESRANVGIRGAAMTVAHTVMAPIVQVTRPNVTQVNNYGRRLIKQAEDKVESAFKNFFDKPEMKESLFKKSHAKLVRGRKQGWRLSTPSLEVAQQRQAKIDELMQEEADFLARKYDPQDVIGGHVLVRDQTKRGEQVSFKGPFWHRTYKTKHTRTNTLSSPRMDETSLLGLVRGVFKIAKAKNLAIEIIGKKVIKARYEQIGRSRYLRFATKHHEGRRSQRDMPVDHSTSSIQNEAVAVSAFKQPLARGITYGDSGLAIDANQLGKVGRTFSGYTIIRGECEGKIFDARSKVTKSIALRMKQF
nr:P1 protein [Konjac mosaic virus]